MTDSAETAALLDAAVRWRDGGAKVAVAVVVGASRSAPRPPGARMVAREDGHVAGSVSGGCVEKEVLHAAGEALRDGAPRLLSFGIADETAWEAGLSCGGEIQVLTLPFPAAGSAADGEIGKLRAALAARKECALRTHLRTGEMRFDALPAAAEGVCGEEFAENFAPPKRAAIVGAAHIAQELAPIVSACGFSAVVIDPRRAWATAERFPQAKIEARWPDDALREMAPDFHTAVVVLSHDPKIDDPALLAALRAETGYIGALGSRRTHDKRLLRLAAAGSGRKIARPHSCAGRRGHRRKNGGGNCGVRRRRNRRLLPRTQNMNPPAAENSSRAAARKKPKIGALLLAAGNSARMGGQNKLLSPWRGKPLVCHAAQTVADALRGGVLQCARIVYGRDAEKTAAAVARESLRCETVFNSEYKKGIASSLQCGLRAMHSEDADGVLVMLGDMPRVSVGDIRAVVRVFGEDNNAIVAPAFGGRRGNPVLIPRRLFSEVMNLRGDIGARALFADNAVCEAAAAAGVLFDIDSPADREAQK